MSSIAGRVAVVPQGEYVATRQYDRLDVVTVGNSSYIAKKKPPIGTAVSNTTYWNKIVDANWGQIGGTLANQTDLQNALDGKANATHSHDDRYYTESEIDTKLGGKANSSHTHTKSEITDFAHNHDDRYYTESEIDTKVNATETEIRDLKMLGWTVPKECPIQNSVADGKFTQRVGRVDLGTLSWSKDSSGFFVGSEITSRKSQSEYHQAINGYCHLYTSGTSNSQPQNNKEITFSKNSNRPLIQDTSYTDATAFKSAMNGVYLYYELATPIEITIDGNESSYKAEKSTITNLLKPTLETTTKNGVTFTNNGDGTYTLNGTCTASSNQYIAIAYMSGAIESGRAYKLVGAKSDAYVGTLYGTDQGNGNVFTYDATKVLNVSVVIIPNTTYSNVVIKPMITTDLSATYDDFVPYTGSTGKLNSDVAEVRSAVGDGWNSSTTYSVGAYVIYQNALYRCKTQNSGQVPTNASYWEKTSVASEIHKNDLKHVDVTYNSVTLNASGYIAWTDIAEGLPIAQANILFVTIVTWGASQGKCFTATNWYLMGQSDATITSLVVRFWYK